MAKITVQYSCGCGFKTDNILEAVLHSDKMGHTLEATGQIRKEGGKKE